MKMFSYFLLQSLKTSNKLYVNIKPLIPGIVGQQLSTNNINNKSPKDDFTTSLHVIGNGSDANPCAVCLSSNEKLYLFNCGEGLQRLFPQYKLKISKINNLFITSNKWPNISGISGLMLTRVDSGVKHLDIHSINCQKLIDFIKYFDEKLNKSHFRLNDYKLEDNKPFVDQSVEIKPIIINTDHKNETNISYICKIYPKSGQLLMDKCFHMKIPRRLLPKLLSRQSVVLENGVHVTPEEVLTPDEPLQCFLILECPSIQFLKLFLKNKQFLENLKNNKSMIECVVHMTPEDVINSSEYQSLLLQLSSETKHLVLNRQNPSFGLHSLHRTQSQLNSLDSKVFPFIDEKYENNKQIQTLNENQNLIKCQTGLQYVFRPSANKGLSCHELDSINWDFLRTDALKDHFGNERQGLEEWIQWLNNKQELLENHKNSHSIDCRFPEIVFLGTGSAQPLANRNVSSILVNISHDSSIILDCGEDTSGQLFRYYGSTKLRSVYNKLKAIFVSHIHTDHHIGLIRLIHKHFEYTNKPLVVFIPPMIIEWLNQYNEEFEDIRSQYIAYSTKQLENIDFKLVLNDLRLRQLKAIPVNHCLDSFGVLLETNENERIVYSGDAEPSDELIANGQNCDLLIHEATQDDSLVSLARDQCHSTVSEAIQVGRKMNAKFTVLTHFSARYGKIPLIPDKEYNNEKLGIAYDFMRVTIPELNRLPLLLPVLNCLYSTHLVKLRHKERINQRKHGIVI